MSFNKGDLGFNPNNKKGHTSTSLLKRRHKRNSNVDLVPKKVTLVTITNVTGTIATSVTCVQVILISVKVRSIVVNSVANIPFAYGSYKCGFKKGQYS